MNNPWFEKKQFGWGWGLPLNWQGWVTMLLFIGIVASLDLITTDAAVLIPLIIGAVSIFVIIARITSGKPEWRNGPYDFSKKRVLKLIVLLGAVVVIFGITQAMYTQRAHSSFEKYYAFRHCTQLLEKTDTYGICQTRSGQTIKIVSINNKWYLDGDGPGVW